MNGLAVAVREARQKAGKLQGELAEALHIHRTYLSKLENGRRVVDPAILRELAEQLDDGWLYKELHETLASIVFVHRKLDGDLVDLHRSSVKAKTLEELQEAIDALKEFDVVNRPGDISEETQEKVIEEVLFPALGAECAIETLVSVICEEYGLSPRDVYRRWNQRMESKGYQKRRSHN